MMGKGYVSDKRIKTKIPSQISTTNNILHGSNVVKRLKLHSVYQFLSRLSIFGAVSDLN
jgi:hypothetical protein